MQVFLDGELLTDCTPATMGEAIRAASDAATTSGRMICEVKVDGVEWNEQRIEEEMDDVLKAEAIDLTSSDARELVATAFREAALALTAAESLQREAAELIQADRQPEAMAPLAEAVEIWQAVEKTVLLGLEYAGGAAVPSLQETEIVVAIERLNGILTGLRTALRENDPIGLSDALLYDLSEAVLEWRSVLHTMTPPGHDEKSRP